MNRLPMAALAALFALSSSSAIVLNSAAQAPVSHPGVFSAQTGIASADKHDNENENEQGDGDHHDNGKHKGWYKHGNGRSVTGYITAINGNMVTLNAGNRTVTVNDQNAINNGGVPNLFVGERVRVYGAYGNDGVFYGNSIAQAGNMSNNGQYGQYGANYGACGANYGGARETVTGYATGGIDGNGNFSLQSTPVANVPVPVGPRYLVHITNNTCVNGQAIGSVQIDLGRHVQVTGIPVGDGRTINAINITYV